MGAKSKTKGNAGERELCRLLTEIFSGSFVRVPNSGAAVGGKNVYKRQSLSKMQDRTFRGDIIPPDHLPRLVIESKSYREFRFHQLLRAGSCSLLDEWIAQAREITDAGDQWFVAFKITLRGWYIVVPEELGDYQFDNYAQYTGKHGRFRITEMVNFFKTNSALVMQNAGPA